MFVLILSLVSSSISHGSVDDSLLSSDLSIELNQHEEPLPILSLPEDEDIEDEEEEEEELPSFLMQMDKSERNCSE